MNAMSELPRPDPDVNALQIDTYDARQLVKDGVRACLVLDGQSYYLRITRAGKLILTK